MKRLFPLLLAVLVLLVGCAPANSAASLTGVEAEEAAHGLYPPQDLSRIANTGRPQFIASYADW